MRERVPVSNVPPSGNTLHAYREQISKYQENILDIGCREFGSGYFFPVYPAPVFFLAGFDSGSYKK